MNDEVGNFLIKFTTEGFDKIEKQLKELNKNMENLGDSFDKGAKKGESFFGALLKWDITVGAITKSFHALKDAIASVFDVAGEMTTLYKKEEDLGVEAKVLERWGIVARRFKGTQNDAYSFFEGVQNLMLKASTPALWSKEDAESMALAGIRWSYNQGASPTANRDAYLQALRDAVVRAGNDSDRRSLLKKYIGQESLYTFFGSRNEDFNSVLEWADKLRVLSKDPSKLRDAQDLETVTIEWEQIWGEIKIELIPVLRDVLVALKPLQEPMKDLAKSLGEWVGKNRDNIAKWVEDAARWIANELPSAWNGFMSCMAKINEIVANIYDWIKEKGVVGKTWDSIKMIWDTAKTATKVLYNSAIGDDDAVSKALGDFSGKYSKEGSGGYLGAGVRAVGDRFISSVENITNNNGGTVVVKPGTYPREMVINPNAPTGAMMASLMK